MMHCISPCSQIEFDVEGEKGGKKGGGAEEMDALSRAWLSRGVV